MMLLSLCLMVGVVFGLHQTKDQTLGIALMFLELASSPIDRGSVKSCTSGFCNFIIGVAGLMDTTLHERSFWSDLAHWWMVCFSVVSKFADALPTFYRSFPPNSFNLKASVSFMVSLKSQTYLMCEHERLLFNDSLDIYKIFIV